MCKSWNLANQVAARSFFSCPSRLGRATYQLITCCAPSWKSMLKFCCSVPNCTVSIFRAQHAMLIVYTLRILLRCGFERQFSQLCTEGRQSSGSGSRAFEGNMRRGRNETRVCHHKLMPFPMPMPFVLAHWPDWPSVWPMSNREKRSIGKYIDNTTGSLGALRMTH